MREIRGVMSKTAFWGVASSLLLIILFWTDYALAQNPLGVGVIEQKIDKSSPFASFFLQIQFWQQGFARTIQQTLILMRKNNEGGLWLMGLSLIYGILHAAGPGHGKAVISSYLIADHASLKRGVILSFFSSLCQAVSAIVIVCVIFFVMPAKLTITANFVVILSFAFVMCLGGWMLLRRILTLFRHKQQALHAIFDDVNAKATSMMETSVFISGGATAATSTAGEMPSAAYAVAAPPLLASSGVVRARKLHSFRQFCADCGKIHLAVAEGGQSKLSWRTALPLIAATGLRPCAGALTVMSFALLNELYLIGTLSVFAMSLGTFVTVCALASLAVYAKKIALTTIGKGRSKNNHRSLVKQGMEWAACLFIFLTGALLFFSSIF